MYTPAFDQDGQSTHSAHCRAMFGRRDWDCHCCAEQVQAGAPRWLRTHFARKLRDSGFIG